MAVQKRLLEDWRQGDFSFVDITFPVLQSAGSLDIGGIAAPGFAMISQSCDILKPETQREFVQVAALVQAEESAIKKASGRGALRYGYVPELADRGYLVDFDVSMTITKKAVSSCARQAGCNDDPSRRAFAQALARQRERFAFPDTFNADMGGLRKWIADRDEKQSPAGAFIRSIVEIRAECNDWENPKDVRVFALLAKAMTNNQSIEWKDAIEKMKQKSIWRECESIEFIVLPYSDLSAGDYLMSDRLNFDDLSNS